MVLQSHGLARSHDNTKSLCLHYHSAYYHQNWQAGGLPGRVFNNNVTPPFDQAVLRVQKFVNPFSGIRGQNRYMSSTCADVLSFYITYENSETIT